MASILLSWVIIGLYAYLYGRAGICILYKGKEKVLQSVDIFIVCGIMILNLYAQIFSLFYKVGAAAFGLLTLGAAACAFYLKYKDRNSECRMESGRKGALGNLKDMIIFRRKDGHGVPAGIMWCFVVIIGTLLWSNVVPQHYDTYLYHAQAIHWVEEYGIVPGLGNLHFRFAHNIEFMTLQSLFSFAWLTGHSLHTVNGFIVLCMLFFVLLTFHREKSRGLQISDILKLGIIAYLIYVSILVSSPNSDIWSQLLLFYVCVKWSEFAEKQVDSPLPYAFLSLLCVYAMTLKLSTAVFVILAVYPAVLLIQRKQWKQIWQHIATGIMITIPFFARDVMISGYLIFPYPELDLFRFDWKMPEQVLLGDRKELIAWGRGNMDVSRVDDTIAQWVPEWFTSIHLLWRILLVITIFAGVLLFINIIKDLKTWKRIRENALVAACMAGLLFWFFSSPSPRYGIVYMLSMPCIAAGVLPEMLCKNSHTENKKYNILLGKAGSMALAAGILFYSMFYFPYSYWNDWGEQTFFWQTDYADRETRPEELGGYTVSVPVQGDQTGYNPFPTTPYAGTMDGIELRGSDFKSGFRTR